MATATQTGVDNAQKFLSTVQSMGETEDFNEVNALLKANDWQGVVDYATTFPYYNFNKMPFTSVDVDAGLNPWMMMALPDDYENKDIRGSVMVIRPYSSVGFLILNKGGVAIASDGSVLETKSASINAGSPVGSPYTVPYQTGEKSNWILSQTSSGYLAFFKDTNCTFVLNNSGDNNRSVWSKQYQDLKDPPLNRSNGYFDPSSGSLAAGKDIKTAFITYAAESWSVSETDTMNLVFRMQPSDSPVMICRGDTGWLCNGSGAAFTAEDYKISLEGLFEYFWLEFLNAGTEAYEWVADIAVTSWDWVENAALDTWDWIENTSSESWEWVEDTWQDIDDSFDDIEDALNPSKW